MSNVTVLKTTKAQRITRTTTDTILVTAEVVKGWSKPAIQRGLTVNAKLRAVAEEIRVTKVIPGVLTLGVWRGKTYTIDGQHREAGFILAGIPEAYVDVRILQIDATTEQEANAAMGEEFERLNGHIVSIRPDDNLRSAEPRIKSLRTIRENCPFVGYDNVRRSENAPVLSMSVVIRTWVMAAAELPSTPGGSSLDLAETLSEDESRYCASFLNATMQAWGRTRANERLWGKLNLTICAWLYRRLVLFPPQSALTKSIKLDGPMFRKCLMRLSATPRYLEWLGGRTLSNENRGPSFAIIKILFAKCIAEETGKKPMILHPPWASNTSSFPWA